MRLFLIYSCIAIPVWGAQFALYFFLRRAGRMKESLAAKCAGQLLAVGSAALGMAFSHEGPGTPWVFWFFVLCTIADALLEISFVPGMLVFGAGHVCLILWLWGLATPSWWSLALWVAVYILTAIRSHKLPTLGKLTAWRRTLGAVWGSGLGLPLVFLLGWEWWPVALGTLLFYISDMLVAKNQLAHWDDKWQKPIMALYWGALYLISVGLWVI